jgi:hypothetical protein
MMRKRDHDDDTPSTEEKSPEGFPNEINIPGVANEQACCLRSWLSCATPYIL